MNRNLTRDDLSKLISGYLTPEIASAAGIGRVDSTEGAQIVGRQPRNGYNYAGLIFPYFWPGEDRPREFRLRRDEPDLEAQPDGSFKEKGKYLSPPGKGNLLYFSPNTPADWLSNPDIPITITEGEKKTLALSRFYSERGEQRLVIGLSGVWNWRGTVGKTANANGRRQDVKGVIADFDRINWQRREVLIVFDANAATNDSVAAARRELAKELRRRGAVVWTVDLPGIAGVNGVDDLLALKGAEFVAGVMRGARSVESVASVESDGREWSEPLPLPNDLLEVPSLPETLIPESLRGWLADIAERLQVPLEFPTAAAIVCLASVIGNQVRIRPKRRDDWTVTPNLWGAIVGRPGVMKSAAIAEAMKPLYPLVKDAAAKHTEALNRWQFLKEAAKAKREALRAAMRDAAKKKIDSDLEEFSALLAEEEIAVPAERRYITNQTTVEKYGELLSQNPKGLLIFRDELSGWLRLLDDERRTGDRSFYLEAWNGDGSYTYDCIGRGTIKIPNTTTSILGGIQPGPLESYLRNALGYGEGDDGLMQRFQMLVYPDIKGDWKLVDRQPDSEAKNRAFDIFKKLSELNAQSLAAEVEVGEADKPFLRFSDEGQEFFNEWFVDLNRSLRSGEFEHPALEAHFAKYKSLMPSLALIFHLCEMATGQAVDQVSFQAAEMAAAWCSFLMEHAKRIYGLGIGAAAIHARTLAKHLQAGDLPDPFTARELYLKHWAGLASSKAVEEPLDLLESLHWLGSVQIQTGGRPMTHYLINPEIRGVKV